MFQLPKKPLSYARNWFTMMERARHWTYIWVSFIQSTPLQIISWRSILILPYYPRLDVRSSLLISVFSPQTFFLRIAHFHHDLYVSQSFLPWIWWHNYHHHHHHHHLFITGFLSPGTSSEPMLHPTTQASSFKL